MFHWALAEFFAAACLLAEEDSARGLPRDVQLSRTTGSWAIYALLVLAAATALTGWVNYNRVGGEAFEEVHEAFANAWRAMFLVRVAGVIVGSLAHRRNLAATMSAGYWRGAGSPVARPRQASIPGCALMAAALAFWTWSATTGDSGHDEKDD